MRRARVTRGALYHHFADKRDLFRAAHESLEAELVARIGAALESAGTDDPVEAMRVATAAFLDAAVDPWARITLIDAPSVLGWAERREIDARFGLARGGRAHGGDGGRANPPPAGPPARAPAAGGDGGGRRDRRERPDPASTRREVEPLNSSSTASPCEAEAEGRSRARRVEPACPTRVGWGWTSPPT